MPAGIQDKIELVIDIESDASSGLGFTVPRAGTVTDVTVVCTATSGGGTVQVGDGTNAISDAIAMATLDAVTRASTLDVTYSTLAAGDTIQVTTNGAADRGKVIVEYQVATATLESV